MSKVFFVGFFFFVASTIAFIVAILTPFWIIKSNPFYRGIFEVCERKVATQSEIRSCGYILTYSDNLFIKMNRYDYAIACASLSIAAASLSIILLWVSGLHMCLKDKLNEYRTIRLRLVEILIAGTLLIDFLTIIIWVVMLAKNLDSNNVITTNEIGWSLWLAVGSTGGYLISLVLFCIHRIDLGAFFENTKKQWLQNSTCE
ncbi:unnamed protein product [Brachionus calyciflorus]|uniref:Uncharacterized protein n=1 Tax=Brachionus calyciflorus TaxID=104777 RepID=A0A813U7Y3_9BILA|nr:unnamed protein product [Brachionus calyciflorus]